MELGSQITRDYNKKNPVLICVLNGSFLFFADLVREIKLDCEIDFLKISSYGNAHSSSGEVKVHKEPDCRLNGKDVLVIEDIIDSGLSVVYLRKWLSKQTPKSLKFISLLIKDEAASVEYKCEYEGFHIPNEFVIGYGLDYAQRFRALPDIHSIKV